jgi:choice-of-anchor B domain-containing protein
MNILKPFFAAGTLLVSITSYSQLPCEGGMAGVFPCMNVDLMSRMTIDQIGGGANLNDIWGWTSPTTGKEYALVGRNTGTSFIDISDPVNPVYLGNLPTHTTPSLWRDIKVFNNHAFIVAEAGLHGMQVFNLMQLDSMTVFGIEFEESAHYPLFGNAHNVAINEDTGFAYAIGSSTFAGGLHIVDINDPLNPQIAGGYGLEGYCHDTHVVTYHGPHASYQGREVAFMANETKVVIVDVTTKDDVVLLSSNPYQPVGYAHQCWLTEDHKYLLVDDELDELNFGHNTRTLIWDVHDLNNPIYMGDYMAPIPSSDHNQYVRGNFVYQSNYSGGLRILNLENIAEANLFEAGYFDTDNVNDNVGFNGSWSNYPFFESKNVIVSSMYSGFFVVRPEDWFFTSVEERASESIKNLRIYPNPAQSFVHVEIPAKAGQFKSEIAVYDLMGRKKLSTPNGWMKPGKQTLDISGLERGMYIVRIEHPSGPMFARLIKE